MRQKNTGFLEGFARRGHKHAGRPLARQLFTQRRDIKVRNAVHPGQHGRRTVGRIHLAAGKHMRFAQHIRQAAALDHEHLEAAGHAAQQQHRGGIARQRRFLGCVRSELHQPSLAVTCRWRKHPASWSLNMPVACIRDWQIVGPTNLQP